jgi:Arc/MetJ-type ribon-helix-helix transcriptional regulator
MTTGTGARNKTRTLSISVSHDIYEAARERMRERVFSTFSEYIRSLIRQDVSTDTGDKQP